MIAYRIVLEPDSNGTLLVSCPDLPGVNTFGDDPADAVRHAVDAVETWIAGLISDGLPVPRPSRVRHLGKNEALAVLPLLPTIKLELYWALKESDLTRADLVRQLGWKRESVDRLFRLDHHSRMDQLERAFRVMHKRIDASVAEETNRLSN
jgi:antitoxin HicB